MTTETIIASEYKAVVLYLNATTLAIEKFTTPILAASALQADYAARHTFEILYPHLGDVVDVQVSPAGRVR